MAVFSPEDIRTMIEAAVKGALQGSRENRQDAGRLDERFFRRVEKFDGAEGRWKEWSFQFKTQLGAASKLTKDRLDDIQKAGVDPDWDSIFVEDDESSVDKLGAELYSIITSLVSGEALMMVRGVPHGNGWKAWSKLFNRYNPKTPARALMAMMNAMSPKKVKDVRDLSQAVEEWEISVKNLKLEHDVEINDQIKTALLTSMVPTDLQDYIFQWAEVNVGYESTRDRVMSLARNRVTMSKPVPMDIGQVKHDDWQEGDTENLLGEDEFGIEYVGNGGACHRCGGFGHFARDCATPKGKGKGQLSKGKGKGNGKDSSKGGGKGGQKGEYGWWSSKSDSWSSKAGGKGKGKTIVGDCWNCGECGHRASECPKKGSPMAIGSVEQHDEVHVGGVWEIAQVEVEEEIEEKEINTVEKDMTKWVSLGHGEITVDSAAEESVCPKEWGGAYEIEEPAKWMKFKNASGGKMEHYGAKHVVFKAGEQNDRLMSLGFQVSEVQKPLAAVWRIAEKGNIVQFGPKPEHNFIQSVSTGDRLPMIKRGGSYVLNAEFVIDESKIDSRFQRQAVTKK